MQMPIISHSTRIRSCSENAKFSASTVSEKYDSQNIHTSVVLTCELNDGLTRKTIRDEMGKKITAELISFQWVQPL